MNVSMPEQLAMTALITAISEHVDNIISSSSDPSEEGLDQIKFLNLTLARFLEATRMLIDYRLKEPPTAEAMVRRMQELSHMYLDIITSIDSNCPERMEIELQRAFDRSA